LTRIALGLITTYQRTLSRVFPASCRFIPTCSEFAKEAISVYGVAKGSWLTARRLARCHPLHPGGYDPVPRA